MAAAETLLDQGRRAKLASPRLRRLAQAAASGSSLCPGALTVLVATPRHSAQMGVSRLALDSGAQGRRRSPANACADSGVAGRCFVASPAMAGAHDGGSPRWATFRASPVARQGRCAVLLVVWHRGESRAAAGRTYRMAMAVGAVWPSFVPIALCHLVPGRRGRLQRLACLALALSRLASGGLSSLTPPGGFCSVLLIAGLMAQRALRLTCGGGDGGP